MSSDLTHESGDQVLAGRSLVVVLREKKTDSELQAQGNVESAQRDNSVVATLQHQPQLQAQTEQSSKRTGSDIFNDFICENKNCYWNPHLEESICNLKYIGYLHPTTLLVGGRDIYVDTVRGAWTRRVLRPPRGFHIVRVGDLESMETQPVHQTQFTPLPEALCLAITDLNRTHSPATFDVIQRALAHTYRRVHPPSEEIIYETLGSLIREHKIVYSGGSYFAMTPDLHMVHTNCIVVHDNHLVIAGDSSAPGGAFPTLFIPLGVTTEKRSISCQTDGVGKSARTKSDRHKLDSSMSSHNTTDDDPVNQRKLFERSRSVRESRSKKEKIDSLSRSESLRYSGERSRQLVKDINLKTSAAHQNKGKGEKTSLLSKLFGRSSNKKRSLSVGDKGRSHKIEHATFSAQFPPPDLAIQVSRMQLQRHCAATLRQDVATQSEVNGEDEDYGYSQLSPVHMRHTEVVEPLRGWASDHSRESSRGGEFLDSRALSKSTKRDRSVTKSHSKRNTESNPMAKHKGHDLKEVVLHKQNTDCDVFAPCRRRDPGHTQNTQVSAFAMSTQHKLSETALHKRNVRSSTKSTRKDLTLLHCQMDVHQKHASRSCKQECDAEKWGYESKHVSRSCHQDVIVASPCGERNSELKHLQKGARQNHRTPVNERRTMSSMQNNVAVSHVVEGNESHNVDLGRKQMRRRSRRMTHEEEYCHEMCPRDPVMRHDVNDTVTQWNSPATLLNNGCPEAEHMAERDGHRLRVFQKYREMYCGSTLDNGGDANADLPLKTHGISRDSGVNFVGLATPRIHKYPTSSLGGGAGDAMECLQDSGFNSPRGLQLTPARSIPLAPGDSMTFVQNLRHLPDVPTDRQPCPAGGTASPRWCSTDVGDAGSFSWSSSSRQTVRPTGESSPQSHPKSSLGLARHKQTVWTSPEPVTMATKCADNQMDADKKGQVRPRDRSPKKHIVGIHGDHHQKSRATADIVSRHPGMSLEPREDYESYKDLGEYKFVAVV